MSSSSTSRIRDRRGETAPSAGVRADCGPANNTSKRTPTGVVEARQCARRYDRRARAPLRAPGAAPPRHSTRARGQGGWTPQCRPGSTGARRRPRTARRTATRDAHDRARAPRGSRARARPGRGPPRRRRGARASPRPWPHRRAHVACPRRRSPCSGCRRAQGDASVGQRWSPGPPKGRRRAWPRARCTARPAPRRVDRRPRGLPVVRGRAGRPRAARAPGDPRGVVRSRRRPWVPQSAKRAPGQSAAPRVHRQGEMRQVGTRATRLSGPAAFGPFRSPVPKPPPPRAFSEWVPRPRPPGSRREDVAGADAPRPRPARERLRPRLARRAPGSSPGGCGDRRAHAGP